MLMAKPAYAMDPFYLSDFSDEDSDDSTMEPIDEQEIYGIASHYLVSSFPSFLETQLKFLTSSYDAKNRSFYLAMLYCSSTV